MEKFIIKSFCFLFFFSASIKSFPDDTEAVNTDGLFITSKGSVKALAVFIQFKDDSTYPENPHWQINKPPVFLNTYLDTIEDQNSAVWGFSDYYRKMSFDSLRVFGKGYSIITNFPESYYRDSLKKGDAAYSIVNREVLTRLDSIIDYSEYDNWTFGSKNHKRKPDGKVDLIFIIYRNSIWPPGPPAQGIAVLGYDKDLFLDSITIKFGFPGSGITNSGGWQGLAGLLRSMKHEFGHLLFGAGHPKYFNAGTSGAVLYLGMWGIMPREGYSANAFEREKLGWIKINNITQNDSVVLKDFVTTGEAVRIPINSNESYIIENHQQISPYDSELDQANGKGLMIYRLVGKGYHPKYQVIVAEGNFNWSSYWVKHPWRDNNTDSLPVYTRLKPDRNGYNIRDWIPHDKPRYLNGKFQIYLMDDDGEGGEPFYPFSGWKGNGKTAFNIDDKRVFAPWTNPGSGNKNNISVVISDYNSGNFYLKILVKDIIITEDTEIPAEEFEFKNNLIIPEGVTLKINPGAKLKFNSNSKIIVHGTLDARGSAADSIYFDKVNTAENWDGIYINKRSKAFFDYTVLKNSVNGIIKDD